MSKIRQEKEKIIANLSTFAPGEYSHIGLAARGLETLKAILEHRNALINLGYTDQQIALMFTYNGSEDKVQRILDLTHTIKTSIPGLSNVHLTNIMQYNNATLLETLSKNIGKLNEAIERNLISLESFVASFTGKVGGDATLTSILKKVSQHLDKTNPGNNVDMQIVETNNNGLDVNSRTHLIDTNDSGSIRSESNLKDDDDMNIDIDIDDSSATRHESAGMDNGESPIFSLFDSAASSIDQTFDWKYTQDDEVQSQVAPRRSAVQQTLLFQGYQGNQPAIHAALKIEPTKAEHLPPLFHRE
ncbi:MAG: hypothetical protein ACHQAX_09745 [Gammaproteobacteria bacterium]